MLTKTLKLGLLDQKNCYHMFTKAMKLDLLDQKNHYHMLTKTLELDNDSSQRIVITC